MKVRSVKIDIDNRHCKAVGVSLAAPLVFEVTRSVLNQGKATAPVDHGNLRASHGMTMRPYANGVKGTVEARARYARMVHEGTSAHPIRARRKKALRFVAGGRVVIVKSVRHPGTRPNRWLTRALDMQASARGFKVVLLPAAATSVA